MPSALPHSCSRRKRGKKTKRHRFLRTLAGIMITSRACWNAGWMTFLPRKGRGIFSLLLWLNTIQITKHFICVTNLRRLWRNSLTRTLRPKEGQCGEFPEFSFCLALSQAWSRRNHQPGNANGLRQKKKNLNKRIQKESAYQDRNFLKTIVPFQQNTTEKQPATPSPRPAKT